jgi:PucR-like helix-turn-helix protein/diguanylate cyclase with GGDEF domain
MTLDAAVADVQLEVERVVGALLSRCNALADAMVEAIQAEIPSYASASTSLIEDVRRHCEAHAHLILVVSASGRAPRRDELGFAREAAARRVRHGVPLDAMLQAFRVGHRRVWDAIMEESAVTPLGRDAALALARPTMEYNDIAATQVAEAYLKEEQRLLATADRERRDLLENLLAGRLPAPGERPAVTELDPEGNLVMVVAGPGDGHAWDPHALHHVADALAAPAVAGAIEPLVVVRQREVVGVLPVIEPRGPDVARALRAAGQTLLARRGIAVRVGVSSVFSGFQGVAHAYDEARQALRRTAPGRPVVALSEMSPFEYLVASADACTRRTVAEKGRLLLESDREGTASDTLLAYVAANLSVKGAAERLFVHPNTVRYRLRRISEITGRDTRSLDELMDLVTVIRIVREEARAGQRTRSAPTGPPDTESA